MTVLRPAGVAAPVVEVLDPRDDPAPEGFAAFVYEQGLAPVWEYEQLAIEAWLARNPPLLAVIRSGGRITGAVVLMLCHTVRAGRYDRPPPARTRRLRPRWAEAYLPLLSGHPACVFDAALPAGARRAAVRELERELVRRLGSGLLGVVYRAMTDDVLPALLGTGRVVRRIDPATVLTPSNALKGPISALDALKGPISALNATKGPISAVGAGNGSTVDKVARGVEVCSGYGRADVDPHELTVLLNRQRAENDRQAWAGGQRSRMGGLHMDTRSPVSTAYLAALVRRPDVDTLTYTAPDGRLLAANLLLDRPSGMDMHHWAADEDHAELYADCVRRRAELLAGSGRPELTAGRGQLEVKRRCGFGTRELSTVAVPRLVMGR